MSYAISLADVRRAAQRIQPHARRTPVVTCAALDAVAGQRLFLKCESFQRVGAFKFRGACNAVLALDDTLAARGVATHSSGNHAAALALAARLRGMRAHIVMPRGAPRVKHAAVVGYGGIVYECEPTLEARESTAARVVAETGATLIPPYDYPDVIAGQGTTALELFEQVPDLDAIVAPVGGGGLVSGVAIVARGVRPSLRVIAAEPAGADDAARSKAAGTLLPQTDPRSIADGLKTSLGKLTWPIVRDLVERVVTVEESEIKAALRLVWERAKLVIEPSAAVAVAAALSPRLGVPAGSRVGVVVSGGNVDLDALASLLA